MKYIISLSLLMAVAIINIHGQGIPIANCPPGEHSVLYCPRMAEPTCDNPTVHKLPVGKACDVPDCFCNTPTVRDTKTKKCVNKLDCS
ncbi:unnamed protein product [Parnassius mnemosyne]|uniref:Uncharacterized protein n=1 Tax=Parnassius mnemosyne TaxID=213953 RepID=A0AAV1KPU6_9NEOP